MLPATALVMAAGTGSMAWSSGVAVDDPTSGATPVVEIAQNSNNASATAAASTTSASTSKCVETTTNGKYWEYRNFLIRGHGKGLKKGNNNVNGDGVNDELDGYLRKASGWTTKQHVANIETLKPRLDGFDGATGLVGMVWVEIANKAMSHYGVDDLNNTHKIDIDVWGRIDENKVAPHSTEDAFVFNPGDGSGHIWATMCFEIRFAGSGPNNDPDAKVRYALKNQVAQCGFKTIARGSGTGNQQVFVGSYIPFFANNNDLASFNTKLEAVNFQKGDTPAGFTCPPAPADGYVTLGGAFFDKNGDGTWQDLNTASNSFLFSSNPQACADMFFQSATPPPSLGVLSDRPNYCLGRCSDPPIINSGI